MALTVAGGGVSILAGLVTRLYGRADDRCNTSRPAPTPRANLFPTMQRRRLLRLGLGSALALGLAGLAMRGWQPGLAAGRLSESAAEVFAAVARAVLDGCLPAPHEARDAALAAHMTRLNATLAGLPAPVQAELSQLLALLSTPAGRIGLAGLMPTWRDADIVQLQAALQAMRISSIDLRQQAYHALRDLTNAAYFADPATWVVLGYPGPQPL